MSEWKFHDFGKYGVRAANSFLTDEQALRWIELQIALENFRSDIDVARERQTLVKYSAVALADDPPHINNWSST